MKRDKRYCFCFFVTVLLITHLTTIPASADTIILKNDKEVKGLVVEKHADRIILSTESREIPILLSGIKDIRYDEPEQNYLQVGRTYEAEKKYGEALAFYEKALETNPNFEEARIAAVAMRSRFWAASTEGPQGEMEKKQDIYDSWSKGGGMADAVKKKSIQDATLLKNNFGLTLEKKGDWVRVARVSSKKDADQAGIRRGDRLVAIDGASLRYLSVEVVTKKMISPRFSSFSLELERDIFVPRKGSSSPDEMGFKINLETKGTMIQKVYSDSAAQKAGLREGDFLVAIAGESTRYMPIQQVDKKIRDASRSPLQLTVRRSAFLTRR